MENAKNLTPKEAEIEKNILEKLKTQYGRTLEDATPNQVYNAVALSVRDTLMEKWTDYRRAQRRAGAKELYYLSFEFLMGRSLSNNLLNMSLTQSYAKVLDHMGFSLLDVEEQEPDAGLGNGGLGRLAACFMDSLATLGLPAFGSSIRYEYGLFEQKIVDGYQVEAPDPWLLNGTAWEVERTEERQYVRFGGTVQNRFLPGGEMQVHYDGATTVVGVPYDVPIAGYHSDVVNTLRLWKAEPLHELDFGQFSRGDYAKATEEKSMAEVLSKVLYPEDNHEEGKALRLKAAIFFRFLHHGVGGCPV